MSSKKNHNVEDDDMDIKEAELTNCNFVKTTLMLLVVIYHCILYWSGTWFVGEPVYDSQVLCGLSKWFNSFHIYAFTLVSGYLFFYMKYERGKYSRFLTFLVNKIKRLIIPYVFVLVIWVIPFAMYFFKYDILDMILKFVLGTSPNQLWFLLMLFGVFIIFYPLSDFFLKHNIYGAVVCILIYGFGLIGQTVLPNVFQIFSACTYISLFLVGFKIR